MLKLIFANLRLHKLRSLTTIGAAVMAFALYGLLCAFDFGMRGGAGSGGEDRLVVMPRFPGGLPHHDLDEIRALPGVRMAGSQVAFHARSDRDQRPVISIAVDPEGFLELFPEARVAPADLQSWLSERTGALVGKTLAARMSWRVGDTVWIRSDRYRNLNGDNLWPLKVSGLFEVLPGHGNADGLYFHYDYFQQSTPTPIGAKVSYFIVRVGDPAALASIAQTIDSRFANSGAETRTSTEKALVRRLVEQLGDVSKLLAWIIAAAALAMMLVNLSAALQSVQARRGALALMKAVGFPEHRIGWLVVAESCLLIALGGSLGMSFAYAITAAPSGTIHAILPGVPLQSQVLALLAIPLLGAVVAVPALLAAREIGPNEPLRCN